MSLLLVQAISTHSHTAYFPLAFAFWGISCTGVSTLAPMPGIPEVSILLGLSVHTCLASSGCDGRPGSRELTSVPSASVEARGVEAMSFSEVTVPGPALPAFSAVNPDSQGPTLPASYPSAPC